MATQPGTFDTLSERNGLRAFELRAMRALAGPLRRRLFRRPYRDRNDYYGVYSTYAEAQAAALALSTPSLPASYDIEAAGRLYRDPKQRVRATDYPLMFWLGRSLEAGCRHVFDLGGNIGVSYYAFRAYLRYPAGLQWTVHDLPCVMEAGRRWAQSHDPQRQLAFAASPRGADGQDVLASTGALQYLEYTLPELLQQLPRPPRHVLVNLTPMHPERSFFTLQNLSIAICPYRVSSVGEFTEGMQALGYRSADHWQSHERHLRIPFEPGCRVDSYHGFYFELTR